MLIPEGMFIENAKYAKNKKAVSFLSNGMFKLELCQKFCLFLNGGDFWGNQASKAYSNREKAYIVSKAKVEKFLKTIQ